jgi:hypothetical protein
MLAYEIDVLGVPIAGWRERGIDFGVKAYSR